MAHDPAAFADMVTLTVKAALAPLLERVAGVEARVAQAMTLDPALAALRDRVVVVETKAAAPIVAPEPHDLSPVLERMAATEARVARLAAVELTVGELRDKFVTLETKAAIPVEAHHGLSAADVELEIRRTLDPIKSTLAVLETRAVMPGPAGKDGAPGLNGKDGVDGMTLDDLSIVQHEDERTFTIRGTVGGRTKDLGTLTVPVPIHRGVVVQGKTYDRGDIVTYDNAWWNANEITSNKPGDGTKAWTMTLRRPRDGKDGKDAETIPVISLGAGRR